MLGSHAPVNENVVEVKVHNKVGQRLLYARGSSILTVPVCVAGKHAHGVCRLSVGHCVCTMCLVLWDAVVRLEGRRAKTRPEKHA